MEQARCPLGRRSSPGIDVGLRTNCRGAGMRRRTAIIIGTCLVVELALASMPASAGSRIRAREVVGGLNQPVAFTFGRGKKIWYVEKSTGQVRIHDLDT